MESHDGRGRGAYGFRLIYRDWAHAYEDLVELDSSVPEVAVDWRIAPPTETFEYVDEERVDLGAKDASGMHVTRNPRTIMFDVEHGPSPDALVHPYTTVPLSMFARWRGDVTLHAGGFVAESSAWAVGGLRQAGKSTTLAMLSQRGLPIVADDLMTINRGVVHAGPHCVDLRADVAERFEKVRSLGYVGMRERYRVPAPAAPPTSPLAGIFLLEWHDSPAVLIEPLSGKERLEWFYRLEYIALLGASDPLELLELATLPAWRVRRHADWDSTQEAVDQMLETVRVTGSRELRNVE